MKNLRSLGLFMALCLMVLSAFIESCTTAPPKLYTHYQTNITRFISIDESTIKIQETMEPTITVPLKIGISFTPSQNYGEGFPEKERMQLMQEIRTQFKDFKFVESIELVPSLYLEEGGGFSNLDKLRQLFDIDVIMLLSYDQSQFKDTGASMDLTKNLQVSLYNFRKEIRSQSGKFKLKLKPGYELEPLKSLE